MIQSLLSSGVHFGLLAMLGWGFSDFIAASLSRKIGSYRAFFWVMVWSFVFLAAYFLATGSAWTVSLPMIALSVTAGILHTIAGISFYKGLQVGMVSLVSPVGAAWSLITVLGGVLLFGEQLDAGQWIAIALVILGTLLVATNLSELTSSWRSAFSDKSILYALIAMIGWGTGFLALNQAVLTHGWLLPNLLSFFVASLLVGGYLIIQRMPISLGSNGRNWMISLATGFLWVAAFIAYGLGIESHLASVISPLGAAFPLVTVLLAAAFLKERVRPSQLGGITAIICGIVLLSL